MVASSAFLVIFMDCDPVFYYNYISASFLFKNILVLLGEAWQVFPLFKPCYIP